MTPTILIIYFLKTRSSYATQAKEPAREREFDTVQFFSTGGRCWRIRTYALDDDVHLWSMGADPEDLAMLADKSTRERYAGDVGECYVLQSEDGLDAIKAELERRGLGAQLNVSPAGPVFWTPEGTTYRTKSTP